MNVEFMTDDEALVVLRAFEQRRRGDWADTMTAVRVFSTAFGAARTLAEGRKLAAVALVSSFPELAADYIGYAFVIESTVQLRRFGAYVYTLGRFNSPEAAKNYAHHFNVGHG